MSLPKWINHSVDAFIEMLAVVDHYVFGHDYDLPVTDAGAERLTELEAENEAWEANELFDQMASGIRSACGPYVRLPEWYPVSSVLMPDGSLSTKRYKSSPLAGVQRAASPEGVSDETPDTPPPSGHTDAELLLAAAAVIEMDGADMLTELAADLRNCAARLANATNPKGIGT